MNAGSQREDSGETPVSETAPTLVVLAAGMGSRFGGLKQVAPVNAAGESLLDYSVYDAARAGFRRVVFVIRREIEQDFSRLSERFTRQVEVSYAFQQLDSLLPLAPPAGRTKPWGTLQATLVAAELVTGPFAVINADDFYGAESYRVLAGYLKAATHDSAMVGFRLRNTLSDFGSVSRGVCDVGADGMLQRVREMKRIVRAGSGARNTGDDGAETTLTGDELVSMNMWGLQASVVPLLREAFARFLAANGSSLTAEAYLPEAVNGLLANGNVKVAALETQSTWCGITYREDLPGVVERIAQMTRGGEYPDVLWP